MTGKNLMKTILATLASVLLLSAAYADAPKASSDAKRDMAVENHIKDLHGKIQITPAQETQWAAVAKTMRDSAIETDKAIDKREAIVGSGTAIDNLNAYGDIAQAHVDGVKRLAAAFAPLYASMPDAQKKVADGVFAHRAHDGKKAAK